jgi:hypothetical protein
MSKKYNKNKNKRLINLPNNVGFVSNQNNNPPKDYINTVNVWVLYN